MNNCKTCKWWETKDDATIVNAGRCTSPKLAFGVHMEFLDDDGEDDLDIKQRAVIQEIGRPSREFAPDNAATTYVVTRFVTGPEFGCVNHEQ